ncbi:hypothetical protein ACFLSQ_03835 [Bacteroidota bacterium]
MNEYEKLSLITNALVALATFLAVFIAIFWSKILSLIFKIKLKLFDSNTSGEIVNLLSIDENGNLKYNEVGEPIIKDTGYYFHLKVINESISYLIENCSVCLVKVERKQANGLFKEEPLTVKRYFQFAPSELYKNQFQINFTHDIDVDFGSIRSRNRQFIPNLITIPTNCNISVRSGEVVRYHLKVFAKSYKSKSTYIYQVSWDGIYISQDDKNDKINNHLIIERII